MADLDILFLVGTASVLAFFVGKLCNRLRLPAVVGYIITGVVLGPSVVGLFKPGLVARLGLVSDVALAFVAFTIGSELRSDIFRKVGRGIINVMLTQSLLTFGLVTLAVFVVEGNWSMALIFGAVGLATAPAGTVVVLQEYRAKGPLTSSLLAVVGLDDGVAIVVYAFAAAAARMLMGGTGDGHALGLLGKACIEILGAIALGALLGALLLLIARRIRSRNDILIVSIALVLACAGLSKMINASLILSNLVLGMVAINLSWKTGQRSYDALQSVTPPVYVLFFVLAGAHLDVSLLKFLGAIGIAYVLSRIAGKVLGAYLGATLSRVPRVIRNYLGIGTLSQAGVAIGLALLVVREFSDLLEGKSLGTIVITTVAATTIIFEIIGPIGTKIAIQKAGEIGKADVKE
jgi:Kef-type K+ transport system membrane component KefB